MSEAEVRLLPAQAREIEWFAFDGRIHRRERFGPDLQRLALAGVRSVQAGAFLQPNAVTALVERLASNCRPAIAVPPGDDYPIAASMPGAPVYRSVCGDVWFHVDGANGALLEKLDPSRRAYRWFYQALHTLDFPALIARPALRTSLIVALCGLGLLFSLTGVVIGWRRLRAAC